MSSRLEGCIVLQPSAGLHARVPTEYFGARLSVRELAPGISLAFAENPRAQGSFADQVRRLAISLSEDPGKVLFFAYCTQSGIRLSELYENGRRISAFCEEDEMHVPLDEAGNPEMSNAALKLSELDSTVEYETVTNAIQLGLAQFGHPELWSDLKRAAAAW